uniref:NADH dehydrogenase subunit 9 n=1 Tax=Halamphora coffeiformis TaxID=1487565 RepID=A0A2R4A3D7_9STRA|nr:NADH dehydrogenase subunit 9 [Halamphora coffeaeformis]AVR57546.1 NADH dehydrogenase subunit 9 [Halamphora coffeaeformis]
MLISYHDIVKVLPVIQIELYGIQHCLLIQVNLLKNILLVLKYHFRFQFKVLTCISGLDYPDNLYRFKVAYELLSIKYNARIRIKVVVDELTPVNSIEKIFAGATWWECEVWDMFGIFFLDQTNITRLLTDYGFQGYPLRKDFPLTGFTESRYNVVQSRVVYENVELAQEYRVFDYMSPWETLDNS